MSNTRNFKDATPPVDENENAKPVDENENVKPEDVNESEDAKTEDNNEPEGGYIVAPDGERVAVKDYPAYEREKGL